MGNHAHQRAIRGQSRSSALYHATNALYLGRRALYLGRRALYLGRRALYLGRRALYLRRPDGQCWRRRTTPRPCSGTHLEHGQLRRRRPSRPRYVPRYAPLEHGQLRRRRPSGPMATRRLTACEREQLCTRRGGHHPTMRYASSSAFDPRGGALWLALACKAGHPHAINVPSIRAAAEGASALLSATAIGQRLATKCATKL